jgi:hypothetical protein
MQNRYLSWTKLQITLCFIKIRVKFIFAPCDLKTLFLLPIVHWNSKPFLGFDLSPSLSLSLSLFVFQFVNNCLTFIFSRYTIVKFICQLHMIKSESFPYYWLKLQSPR